MSKMGNHIVNLQEIPVYMECPQCGGTGEYEVDVPRPHASGFNEGFIDSEWVICEECLGNGEVYKPCSGCGETLTFADGKGVLVCRECREGE